MSPNWSESNNIAVALECGDLAGWVSECDARTLIKCGQATVQSQRRSRVRRLVLLADPEAPLRGRARRQAVASYLGRFRFTYEEALPNLHRRVVMLKRINACGQFVRW